MARCLGRTQRFRAKPGRVRQIWTRPQAARADPGRPREPRKRRCCPSITAIHLYQTGSTQRVSLRESVARWRSRLTTIKASRCSISNTCRADPASALRISTETRSSVRKVGRRPVPEDELILNCGRTWQLTEPEYFSIWRCHGLFWPIRQKMDRNVRRRQRGSVSKPVLLRRTHRSTPPPAVTQELVDSARARGGAYYVEFFEAAQDQPEHRLSTALIDWFQGRGSGSSAVQPLVYRCANWSSCPDPGGIAVWRVSSFSGPEPVLACSRCSNSRRGRRRV